MPQNLSLHLRTRIMFFSTNLQEIQRFLESLRNTYHIALESLVGKIIDTAVFNNTVRSPILLQDCSEFRQLSFFTSLSLLNLVILIIGNQKYQYRNPRGKYYFDLRKRERVCYNCCSVFVKRKSRIVFCLKPTRETSRLVIRPQFP